jgi:hypothetical protein
MVKHNFEKRNAFVVFTKFKACKLHGFIYNNKVNHLSLSLPLDLVWLKVEPEFSEVRMGLEGLFTTLNKHRPTT